MFKLPSLTELFFGKGVDPTPSPPPSSSANSKKPKVKWTSERGIGIEDDEEILTKVKKKANKLKGPSKSKGDY